MNDPGDPGRTADAPPAPADPGGAGPLGTTADFTASGSTVVPPPAGGPGPAAPADGLPAVPGYRVLREIARGGMGRVLAAHDLALGRDVALKVLLPGANAERFVREAKITARLPHPGVPPVHALGTLADGSPFLAMKLVAGRTLAEEMATADRPRLLRAFTQVCQAVGFAHSRGVVHRDLKPANVMVGAFGEVQVMDWGLAKDLSGRDLPNGPPAAEAHPAPVAGTGPPETTDYGPAEPGDGRTQAGQVLGTPAYLAPEQARGEATDARADVFTLGGILCAILTGQPPFGGQSVRDVIRRAAAGDLAEAHARLGACGADAEVVALCRRCLSPAPADRPADGRAVADALTAYLNGVEERLRAAEVAHAAEAARAAEATERARAERRARRVQLVAASLLLLVLLGGVVGTTFGLVQAGRAKVRAETAEGETRRRADELQKVSDFQAAMLRQVDPAAAGLRLSADVRARFEAALAKAGVPPAERVAQAEAFASQWGRVNATDAALELIDGAILKPALAAIDRQFRDQPVLDAALRETLAERYIDLGLYDAAGPLLERALETRRLALGAEHPDTLRSLGHMGNLLKHQGKRDEAMACYREALDASRRVLGEDHPDTLGAIGNVGSLLMDMGKNDEAAPYCREALDRLRQLKGEDDPATLTAMNDMGLLLKSQGKLGEAATYYREVLEKRRRALGADHPNTITSLGNLGGLFVEQGKVDGSAACFREVLERRRRLLGEVHPLTLAVMNDLGDSLSRQGKYVEAEALMREALAAKRRLLGADHPSTLTTLNNLAVFLIQRGKAADAEPMCLESLEKNRRVSGPEHPNTLVATNVVGFLYLHLKQPAKAEPYVRQAVALSRRINGEQHPDTLIYTHNLGTMLLEQDKFGDAEPHLRTVAEKGGRTLGTGHPITLSASVNLGSLLSRQMRYAEAAQLLTAAEPAVRKSTTPAGVRLLAILLRGLGRARAGLRQFEAAEANLLEAHPLWVKIRGAAHSDTHSCVRALVDLYTAWHAAQPGKGHDARAAEWQAKLGAPSPRP